MTEYQYKGFKVHYDIQLIQYNLYRAKGSIESYLSKKITTAIPTFQTESFTQSSVRAEIEKLINNYINFERKQNLRAKNTFKLISKTA